MTDDSRDSERLLKLNREKAVTLLMEALDKKNPRSIRIKAIAGLGTVREAVDSLIELAIDNSEEISVRGYVLNLGMRWQRDPRCLDLALKIVGRRDMTLAPYVIWILSDYKSPEAIAGLRQCFDFFPSAHLSSLVHALWLSGDPEASRFVWQRVDLKGPAIPDDLYQAYALVQANQPIVEAKPIMAELFYSTKDTIVKRSGYTYFKAFPNEAIAYALLRALRAQADRKEYYWEPEEAEALIDAFISADSVTEPTKAKLREFKPKPKPQIQPSTLSSIFGTPPVNETQNQKSKSSVKE